MDDQNTGIEVAVIALAGRFPGARNTRELWENLRDGVESIRFFSDEELLAERISEDQLHSPEYVRAKGVLDDADLFDAQFFDYSPREAAVIDPQQRIFLECAWEALENAGYDSRQYDGTIGVYAGTGKTTYLLTNLRDASADLHQVTMGNDKDHLCTRVCYKLDLTGPGAVVQTACSTSLVAVHLACQALLCGECDIALAGGVSVSVPLNCGYLYQKEGILSPDGHCRAFDSGAAGTVPGNGVGIVVLKRLDDALAENDRIRAVIKSSAINNDGASKVGYTAPSVDGQAAAISKALAVAGIHPETVQYVEAHGTGTALGDPIEVAGLTDAFRAHTDRRGYCAIGSVKTNFGHLDAAAGVTGLIKAILALENRQIPPSLHFERANPELGLDDTPFYVNTTLTDWPDASPRRAGVSSFGIGGTNAHVVVEEAPTRPASGDSRDSQLILLSAKTPGALEEATRNLAEHLRNHSEIVLGDVAYTLKVGRRPFKQRRMVVCRHRDEAISALESLASARVASATCDADDPPLAFMFPGQGTQHVNMGAGLYRTESVFRACVDKCCELLLPHLDKDLRTLLYPSDSDEDRANRELSLTEMTQPALFVTEFALARLWMSWGLEPDLMIGHSIGEYVAACLAGVFSLRDALGLVATRGRLMQNRPAGAMMAVALDETQLLGSLGPDLSLAAVNEPSSCVVSGPFPAVEKLRDDLESRGVESHRLHTSHAFHSSMMEPVIEELTRYVAQIELRPPRIPFVSNLTGERITDAQATDATYWGLHLRRPVRFAQGLQALLDEPQRVLLEVGPGQTLGTFARRHPSRTHRHTVVSSMRHPKESRADDERLIESIGRLWLSGINLNWPSFYRQQQRRRIPLPTYPFQRQRYWIDASMSARAAPHAGSIIKRSDVGRWFYVPTWHRTEFPVATPRLSSAADSPWLILADEQGLGRAIAARLEESGRVCTIATPGAGYARHDSSTYTMDPLRREDYGRLLTDLEADGMRPAAILHLTAVSERRLQPDGNSGEVAFLSLLYTAQALVADANARPTQLVVVTSAAQDVSGDEQIEPQQATVLGLCRVIPQEHPQITCRTVDVEQADGAASRELAAGQLVAELCSSKDDVAVAYRGRYRWVQSFAPLRLPEAHRRPARIRDGAVFLITGGLGRIGLEVAEYLARVAQARLVLIGRSPFPGPDAWDDWLREKGDSDAVSQKIARLRTMERLGSMVHVAQGDVAEEHQMRRLLAEVKSRFGAIHGLVHAAAILGSRSMTPVVDLDAETCREQFRPKIDGLLVLDRVLRGEALDVCMVTSSLASVLGGIGFGAYAAANAYIDAFACRPRSPSDLPWQSVNWDGWRFGDGPAPDAAAVVRLAMDSGEGIEALSRLMDVTHDLRQVVVSTGDLDTRLDIWVRTTSKDAADAGASESMEQHARPEIGSSFVAPRNDVERGVASIWEEMLGIKEVGVLDSFFDLGGHSLLATRVASRLRDTFGVDLSIGTMLEEPTVAGLAKRIDSVQWAARGARTESDEEREELEL